jgi:folate-dependent tRNA-U54 methylase TrmFO/GidA
MKKMFLLKHNGSTITRYYGYKNDYFNCLITRSKYFKLIETIYYKLDNEKLQINFHTYFADNLEVEVEK